MEHQSTQKLQNELSKREGVTEIIVAPYEKFVIVQDQRTHEFTGPVQVLINQDDESSRKKPEQLMDELELLSVPLIEFLNKNFNPHCRVEITQDSIKVTQDVIGIPINYLTGE